jgi:hypothetical protein
MDSDEDWGVLSPQLDSFDANMDGLALKKMISMGKPLHYLAEPESATRTTAEAAGTPTFRNLAQIQKAYKRALTKLAKIAVTMRKRYDNRVRPDAKIIINAPDITEKDNSNLALAMNRTWPVAMDMYDRTLIDERELMKIIFKMGGETFDDTQPRTGLRKPLVEKTPPGNTPDNPSEPDPGEPEEGAE